MIKDLPQNIAYTLKGCIKVVLQSRRCTVSRSALKGESLIIMGNGPSLADTISDYPDVLASHSTMAVNFAANAPEFVQLRPRYYVIADPVFFRELDNDNVKLLWANFNSKVTWPMTLFLPAKSAFLTKPLLDNKHITVEHFNPVGVEGFKPIAHAVYRTGRAMPRPRNVLVAALMVALKAGYRDIYITGADHSWTRTLDISEQNEVISVQPHFYKDNESEHRRVRSVYRNIRLHQILYSFYVAFKSYFDIEAYARSIGAHIYNATPGSFIDAFERRSLKELRREA